MEKYGYLILSFDDNILSQHVLLPTYLQHANLKPWHDVFYGTSGLLVLEFLTFSLFASGEEQEWNRVDGAKRSEEPEDEEGMLEQPA